MAQYKDFISENVAPKNVRRIGIYDSNGNRVGQIPLGNLAFPNAGEKQYSFGAISDIHLQPNVTAQADFQRALTYLNETEDVAFTCICGDLTDAGTAAQLAVYKQHIDAYSANTPVYEITGNHEGRNPTIETDFKTYTGKSPYYSFEYNGDVFIMVGIKGVTESGKWPDSGTLFTKEELQWLYETLEANRNKRCFLFQHVRPQEGSGNALGQYHLDIWGDSAELKEQTIFESLLKHYKNLVFFHGHSHLKFHLQKYEGTANYDHIRGCHSVHIPSLAVPREDIDADGKGDSIEEESEGYVVDVYENGIHLRGRDFVKEQFLPIASYWLDTTLQTIEANTYKDNTGTLEV